MSYCAARGPLLLIESHLGAPGKTLRGGIARPPFTLPLSNLPAPWNRPFKDHLLTRCGTSCWKTDLNLSNPLFPDYSSVSVSMFIVRSLEHKRHRSDGLDLSVPHHPEGTTANILVCLFTIFFSFLL